MAPNDDQRFMRLAIDKSQEGMDAGNPPFGACLVRDGEILATTHNTVPQESDITRHAEIDAVREACVRLGTPDLSGSVLYATATPCAMCFTAAETAGIDRIVIGVGPEDFRPYFPSRTRTPTFRTPLGTTENGIVVEIGVLRDECLAQFKAWAER
jgi:tRNA(Arg) A34 adenosine deaminase TadA